jgi:hypothetical protein
MTENMWKIPNVDNIRTPASILREQADYLTSETNGLLHGRTLSSGSGDRIVIGLHIVAPALNYTITLVTYGQKITEMYPGYLSSELTGKTTDVRNEEQFIEQLRSILSSRNVEKVLTNLMAQAKT